MKKEKLLFLAFSLLFIYKLNAETPVDTLKLTKIDSVDLFTMVFWNQMYTPDTSYQSSPETVESTHLLVKRKTWFGKFFKWVSQAFKNGSYTEGANLTEPPYTTFWNLRNSSGTFSNQRVEDIRTLIKASSDKYYYLQFYTSLYSMAQNGVNSSSDAAYAIKAAAFVYLIGLDPYTNELSTENRNAFRTYAVGKLKSLSTDGHHFYDFDHQQHS